MACRQPGCSSVDLVGPGRGQRVARPGGGGEEPERVVVGAVHRQRLDAPRRCRRRPAAAGRRRAGARRCGRPWPTRAARSSPAGAGGPRWRRAARARTPRWRAGASGSAAGSRRTGRRRGRSREAEELVGVAQRDARARVPLLQLARAQRVVGEQEVQHRVRLPAAAALAVRAGPRSTRPVRRGPGPPGGPVEHHGRRGGHRADATGGRRRGRPYPGGNDFVDATAGAWLHRGRGRARAPAARPAGRVPHLARRVPQLAGGAAFATARRRGGSQNSPVRDAAVTRPTGRDAQLLGADSTCDGTTRCAAVPLLMSLIR